MSSRFIRGGPYRSGYEVCRISFDRAEAINKKARMRKEEEKKKNSVGSKLYNLLPRFMRRDD